MKQIHRQFAYDHSGRGMGVFYQVWDTDLQQVVYYAKSLDDAKNFCDQLELPL